MVTWIPSIFPLYVSIYTSTMDPMQAPMLPSKMGTMLKMGHENVAWRCPKLTWGRVRLVRAQVGTAKLLALERRFFDGLWMFYCKYNYDRVL